MTRPARIPADVHRPDRVVGPFTARQAAILAATAAALYLLWTVAEGLIAAPVFLAGAVPVAALAVVVALGQRDGLSMDRLLLAAVRHRLSPRAPTPNLGEANSSDVSPRGAGVPDWITAHATVVDEPTPARGRRLSAFPARTVTPVPTGGAPGGVGVVDLGADGLAVIAVVSTVNFALRTPAEQDGLVVGFARYLHTLGGPVQILIRALPVDLHRHLHQLHTHAQQLPHPALAAAAQDHLAHLARLGHRDGEGELLTRQVLLVLREPHRATTPDPYPSGRHHAGPGQPGRGRAGLGAAEHRLLRRLHGATTLLAPLDLTVTVLDAAHAISLLTHTCNPDYLNNGHDSAEHDVVRGTAPVTVHNDGHHREHPPSREHPPGSEMTHDVHHHRAHGVDDDGLTTQPGEDRTGDDLDDRGHHRRRDACGYDDDTDITGPHADEWDPAPRPSAPHVRQPAIGGAVPRWSR